MRTLPILLVLALLLPACRTPIKTVPIIETRYVQDTVREEKIIYIKDESNTSEHVSENSQEKFTVTVNDKGDTLRTDREVTRTRDTELISENARLLALVDSLSRNRTENSDKEKPVEVERDFSAWELFRLRAFWWLAGLSAALTAWHFRRPLTRLLNL